MTRWSVTPHGAKPADATASTPNTNNAHGQHTSAQRPGMWRGPFGTSVFRLGRAPMPPSQRRPPGLQARRSGVQQQGQLDPSQMSAQDDGGGLDTDDEKQKAAVPAKASDEAQTGAGGDRGQRDAERHLKFTQIMSQRAPSEKDFEAWVRTATAVGDRPQGAIRAAIESALALVGALRRCIQTSATVAPQELPAQAVQSRLVGAYLATKASRGAFGSLERVKQVLLDPATAPPRASPAAPPDETQQVRNMLLPLLLLNIDRPRTPPQRGRACEKLDLIANGAGARLALASRQPRKPGETQR